LAEDAKFTAEAARRWEGLGEQLQTKLLSNVWCVACSKTTTIVSFSGKIARGDLVLEGRCITCGGRVARVIEGR
jgi:hypothetical protein